MVVVVICKPELSMCVNNLFIRALMSCLPWISINHKCVEDYSVQGEIPTTSICYRTTLLLKEDKRKNWNSRKQGGHERSKLNILEWCGKYPNFNRCDVNTFEIHFLNPIYNRRQVSSISRLVGWYVCRSSKCIETWHYIC